MEAKQIIKIIRQEIKEKRLQHKKTETFLNDKKNKNSITLWLGNLSQCVGAINGISALEDVLKKIELLKKEENKSVKQKNNGGVRVILNATPFEKGKTTRKKQTQNRCDVCGGLVAVGRSLCSECSL